MMDEIFVTPVTEWGWTKHVEPQNMASALEFMLRFHYDHPEIPVAGCPACKNLLDRWDEINS